MRLSYRHSNISVKPLQLVRPKLQSNAQAGREIELMEHETGRLFLIFAVPFACGCTVGYVVSKLQREETLIFAHLFVIPWGLVVSYLTFRLLSQVAFRKLKQNQEN